jgi:antitoxin VapB
MTKTTIFRSRGSQTVRLPKDVAFPKTVRSVMIIREGMKRIVVPANASWDDFFDSPGIDVGNRDQPKAQKRLRGFRTKVEK